MHEIRVWLGIPQSANIQKRGVSDDDDDDDNYGTSYHPEKIQFDTNLIKNK